MDFVAYGEKEDMKKNFAAPGKDALRIGAALHYEDFGEDTSTYGHGGMAQWTADATWKFDQFALFGALYGHRLSVGANGTGQDSWGGLIQLDYAIADTDMDVFARYEYIDAGNDTPLEPTNAITAGVNYHFNKQVKLTSDVVYIVQGQNPTIDNAKGIGQTPADSGGLLVPKNYDETQESPWAWAHTDSSQVLNSVLFERAKALPVTAGSAFFMHSSQFRHFRQLRHDAVDAAIGLNLPALAPRAWWVCIWRLKWFFPHLGG